ncbi:MAG: HEAT repeat domain-containing protein [Gemmatimonadales bacterium]
MTRVTVILVITGLMLAVGLLTVLAWFFYTTYLDRVERRLAARKSLYRELVSGLATRDRTLLESTINQMKTLYDLDALEAVLEEQARGATGRPRWLLEVYDELGLVDKYIDKLGTARKWRDRAFAAELLGRVGSAKAVPALLATVDATRSEDADVREIALRALARIADPGAVEPLIDALERADAWLIPRIADILARHRDAAIDPLILLLGTSSRNSARAWAANVLGELRAQRAYPALVRGLSDPDDEVRGKSATALGRLGDRRAIAHLLDHLLTDSAPFVRVRIACTLGQFGGPEVIDRLVHALRDPAWWVRMRSVEALEQIGAAAEGPLVVALDDPDPEIRARAAVALERLGVPDKVVDLIQSGDTGVEANETLVRLTAAGTPELLGDLLSHPSSQVRGAVITAISRAKRRDLAGGLVQTAAGDSEPSLRALAFDTLRSLRIEEALTVAVAGLSDPDQRVRAAAIRLIGELGGREAVELLRSQTSDPDAAVRAAAAQTLGALRAGAAQPDFQRLLGDPKPAVRESATLGAAAAGLRPLVPGIVELLEDSDEGVRKAAAAALGELGDRSAVPALLRAFANAPVDLRETIVRAVSRLDVAATSELVGALLDSPDTTSKLTVVRTLGRIRSPGAAEVLARLSHDPEAAVRANSIAALGRCALRENEASAMISGLVADSLRDSDASVRARAIEAAVRLALDDVGPIILRLLQNDPSTDVRERAALATGLLRLSGGEDALMAAARRKEPANLRAAAALASGVFNPNSLVVRVVEMPDETEVREQLRQRLKNDPWFRLLARRLSRARGLELRALAAPSPEDAQLVLATGMRRTLDAGERVRLISGLRAMRGEQSLSALLQIVREDPSPEVRTAALAAASDLLDTEELLAVGGRALGDPSLMVRRAAVNLFSRVTPAGAYPKLIRSLRMDDDPAVLAAAAELAEEHFESFREIVSAMPLDSGQTVLLVRLARFIHHPELPLLLLPFARIAWPEVREAVAELWRQRPDVMDPEGLEALVADPAIVVRQAAAGAAAAAQRYHLLDRMTQDPDPTVRRQVAVVIGRTAPVPHAGVAVLERLALDPEMTVRAAAYAARLLQGIAVPLPPGLDTRVAAEAVRDTADLPSLRETARSTGAEERRLAAALALALLQDEVAREVARTDPVPAIRHRVGGALELALPNSERNQ